MSTVSISEIRNYIKSIDYNNNSVIDTKTYTINSSGRVISPGKAKTLEKPGELGSGRIRINEASLFTSYVNNNWDEMDPDAQMYANDIGYYLCQGEAF